MLPDFSNDVKESDTLTLEKSQMFNPTTRWCTLVRWYVFDTSQFLSSNSWGSKPSDPKKSTWYFQNFKKIIPKQTFFNSPQYSAFFSELLGLNPHPRDWSLSGCGHVFGRPHRTRPHNPDELVAVVAVSRWFGSRILGVSWGQNHKSEFILFLKAKIYWMFWEQLFVGFQRPCFFLAQLGFAEDAWNPSISETWSI